MFICLVNMYRNQSVSFYKRPQLLSFIHKTKKKKRLYFSHIWATKLEQQTCWSDILRGWKWEENYLHVWQKANIWCMWLVSILHCIFIILSLHGWHYQEVPLFDFYLIIYASFPPSSSVHAGLPFLHIPCSTMSEKVNNRQTVRH